MTVYRSVGNLQERGDPLGAGSKWYKKKEGGKEMIDLGYIIDWTEAPGAFPSGGYQDVRDADSAEFA